MSKKTSEDTQIWRNHNSIYATQEFIKQASRQRYDAHKEDRGDSWLTSDRNFLIARLIQEIGEFLEKPDFDEAGDVLNFMAMIIRREESDYTKIPSRRTEYG